MSASSKQERLHSTLTKLLTQIPHRTIAFLACVLVLVGMYLSRAMMSIGMMVLIGNALINHQVVSYWKSFRRQPHLLILSLYFLYAALSVLEHRQAILFATYAGFASFSYPAICIYQHRQMGKQMGASVTTSFCCNECRGIGWSLIQYYSDKQAFDAGYHYSHQIPTPLNAIVFASVYRL
ncbi:MAG: hypothetical protein HWD58_16080 [Bacteroidota bacterium]|nr:MAG: hypothetical protein HWD58_16080 [Bacteroidota bacterium]